MSPAPGTVAAPSPAVSGSLSKPIRTQNIIFADTMRNERTQRMLQSALERQSGVQNYVFGDLTADLRRAENPVSKKQCPTRVGHIGTGVMCIHRQALYTFRDNTPDLAYVDGTKRKHLFFDVAVHNGALVGEDVLFCRRAIRCNKVAGPAR